MINTMKRLIYSHRNRILSVLAIMGICFGLLQFVRYNPYRVPVFAVEVKANFAHSTTSLAVNQVINIEEEPAALAINVGVEPDNGIQLVNGNETGNKLENEIENELENQTGNEIEIPLENDDEYANFAIAQVKHYVNVRSTPDTNGEILGKMYNGSVAQIMDTAGEENDWLKVKSGTVEGYIKKEYFICGEEAQKVIDDYITYYVQVRADRLNVRKEPDVLTTRIGYLDNGEKAKLIALEGDWCKIQYSPEKEGYVSAEYITIVEEYITAKSLEEEQAEQKAFQEKQERQKISEETAPEKKDYTASAGQVSSNEELREQIVTYAMQFLGNAYIHGGNSLETGTDCSGFTSLIYSEFGYAISRTPKGQYQSNGRSIDYSEIQKGDVICYSSNGKTCTHVALYIGDGQIIHAANAKKGVVIYEADYDTIIGVKNMID